MTQSAIASTGATPFPRTLAQRDRERLARYREFLDYYEGRRGAAPAGRRDAR